MASRDRRVVDARTLLAQRNVLVLLSSALASEQTGGVLAASVDAIARAMPMRAILAYRMIGSELELMAEQGLPRKAKAWLSHLAVEEDDPWFVAQRVAQNLKPELDEQLANERAGLSLAPALKDAGWGATLALPIAVGRTLHGVLVVAGPSAATFDKETVRVLESAAGVIALALHAARDDNRTEDFEQAMTVQLATMGLLASGVAGELEAPLTNLRLQLEFQDSLVRSVRSRADEPMHELDELGDITLDMLAAVRRIGDIVDRLSLTSQGAAKTTTLDFSLVVSTSAAQMRGYLETAGIEFETHVAQEPIAVDGRAPELRLLIAQLLLQAAEQCLQAENEEPRIALTLERETGRVVLTVDASGRPPGSKKRGVEIFDALFARGRGAQLGLMGMGLAKQTVRAHNGHIEVAPSPLGGTQVAVMLPISLSSIDPDARESMVTPTLPVSASADPVVLWIDDDPVMGSTVKRSLDGYEVRLASSLAQAEARFAALAGVPAAIFCVVELPDGSTIELHRRASPELRERFVFMSSGVIPQRIANYLLESRCPTLIKPVRLDEIFDVLESHEGRVSAPTLDPLSARPEDD